jgi:Flp pilus assembly protein TadG
MLKELTALWRRYPEARTQGAVTVELGISAPLLILFVLGIVDYGGLMNVTANLLGATRAGGQYAGATWLNPNINAAAGTQNQVCAFAISCPTVTAGTAQACSCVDGTAVACPAPGAANPCAAQADPRVLSYVSVTASATYQPILNVASFTYPACGGIANRLCAQSIVRVQ